MLLGVRDDCMSGASLEDKLQTLADQGYDFLELVAKPELIEQTVGSAADGKYFPKDELRKLNRMVAEKRMPIRSTSAGFFPGFADGDDGKRAQIAGWLKDLVWLTAALGAEHILVATRETKDLMTLQKIYTEELGGVFDYAYECGVTICLEPVGRYSVAALAALIRAIDHPAVEMYFDMGNCIWAGEDPMDMIRLCSDITGALHIKGGEGLELNDMPLCGILQELLRAGFDGPGVMEIEPGEDNEALSEALDTLDALGYRDDIF